VKVLDSGEASKGAPPAQAGWVFGEASERR
jgi:hypothetical protein